MNTIISDNMLIDKAIEAINSCFVCHATTKKRYGCAVYTSKGNVYTASQYSSYNHITNIHAEMGAIYIATMNHDEKILKMALVCNENINKYPMSCGICLQFIHEHIQRTCDIKLIYSSLDKSDVLVTSLDKLLPKRWESC